MILYTFPNIVKAKVIKRPSATIRSPYVADIMINNHIYLAHSPSLGCCGLADAGATVWVRPLEGKHTKCDYQICLSDIYTKKHHVQIGLHPKCAESIAEKALKHGFVHHLQVVYLEKEKTFLNSRFDFYGQTIDNVPFICEVKTVPLADYADVSARERKRMNFDDKAYNEKIAYFPDGYRKHKDAPVSPRATKHVRELAQLKRIHPTWRCVLLFIIQREDVSSFQTSRLDKTYVDAVYDAHQNGVEIKTIQVKWDHGEAHFIRNDLPITL